MPIITRSPNSKILPKFVVMSAYQIYTDQVKGTLDSIRYAVRGMDYTPPQYGGLSGQRVALTQEIVLQVVDFEVS